MNLSDINATNHPNFGFTGIIWKYAFSAKETFSWRLLNVQKFRTWTDIYAGQMWLLIILLARHLHAYGGLSINYCERRLKVFFFSDNHLAFLSHVQILHAFNLIQIFLWSLLWLAEEIVIQIWKMFKTREVTRRSWSGAEVVSECSIKYSFQPIVLHPSDVLFSMHLTRKNMLNNSWDPIDPRHSI